MSVRAAAVPAPEPPSTRDVILDAAERCFAERGFAGVSTREIAAEAGLRNQASLYHHFTDKRALYEAALARGAARGDRRRGSAESRGRRAPAPLPEGRRHAAARRGTRRTEARMRLADIDLSNPDLFAAGPPHEAFRVLRREAPLFWNGNGGSDGSWA